jgi:hypothetical protein
MFAVPKILKAKVVNGSEQPNTDIQPSTSSTSLLQQKTSPHVESASRVWVGSTRYCFQIFGNKAKSAEISKKSDDKVITGYTDQGLPFGIMVNGNAITNDDKRRLFFNFVDVHILPLITDYVENLSRGETLPSVITTGLISTISKLRERLEIKAEFTLALYAVYRNRANNKLFLSGFSIGNSSVFIRKPNGSIIQVAYNTRICEWGSDDKYGICDGFYDYGVTNRLTDILHRNDIFDVVVEPHDHIFLYDYLPASLLMLKDAGDETRSINNGKRIVYKYGVNASFIKRSHTRDVFFSNFLDAVRESGSKETENAKSQISSPFCLSVEGGDDYIITVLEVPAGKEQLRMRLQIAVQDYLLHRKTTVEVSTTTRLWTSHHGKNGEVRAHELIEKIIDPYISYDDLINLAKIAFIDSGTGMHSLSRYLYPILFETGTVIRDDLPPPAFARLKNDRIASMAPE